MSRVKPNIHLQEIADVIAVPRHFLGKVMKRLAKSGVLDSAKGRTGGFMLNDQTLSYSLKDLIILIEGDELFNACVIGFKKCNEKNPCPLHHQIVEIRKQLFKTYSETKISDLLIEDKNELLKSLIAA